MRGIVGLVAGALVLAAGSVWAMEHPAPKPVSAELERIKTLAGRWEGTGTGHEAGPVIVEYHVTSGGSAVVETLSPGTEHEMVSVYHDRNGTLAMTHYCMLGNQPELTLQESGPGRLVLSLSPDSAIDAAHETHMHALTLTWNGPNQLTQAWTAFEHGAASETSTFSFTRTQ